jgi:protein-S-isoprenylcysteine O-methyltransferase Ste14
MEALIPALRTASVALFAAPLLLRRVGRARAGRVGGHETRSDRIPVLTNFAAFGLFMPLLVLCRMNPRGPAALALAAMGCLLAAVGAAVLLRSRLELGSAWSLVAKADEATGLVTTGPYRLVRHPVYLGLLMLASGEALAFGSWPAALVLLTGIGPTFLWRAVREERVLRLTFGERFDSYRKQTRMIVPYLL